MLKRTGCVIIGNSSVVPLSASRCFTYLDERTSQLYLYSGGLWSQNPELETTYIRFLRMLLMNNRCLARAEDRILEKMKLEECEMRRTHIQTY